MDASELERRIEEFPTWHYSFEFDGGVRTPVASPDMVNRHEQRRRYFFAALLELTGGTLSGRRVLDLGCSAGFWSLAALEAGADYVLGIDAQSMYVEQAEFVLAQKGIDPARYDMRCANVFDQELDGGFDVVLCLGLMDHVARPVELFALMARARPSLIVLETTVSRSRLSLFEVSHMHQRKDLLEGSLVLIPSRDAVGDLARAHGFETVAPAVNISDYNGLPDYRRERRLAFICADGVDLSGVRAQPPAPAIPWWLRDPRALVDAYV